MSGLIRCDINGCESLVEPHLARCGRCRRQHGPSPAATTERERQRKVEQASHSPRASCPGLTNLSCGRPVSPGFDRCKRCDDERKRRYGEAAAGIPSGMTGFNRPVAAGVPNMTKRPEHRPPTERTER